MPHDDAVLWPGLKMLDRDGEKIGRIEDVFVDPETEKPEWALVNTGESPTRSTFVPLEGAASEHQAVLVPFTRNRIRNAPAFEADHQLTPDEEAAINRHYAADVQADPGGLTPVERGGAASRAAGSGSETKTKASYKTTELILYVLVVAGILIASKVIEAQDGADYFPGDKAWLYLMIITVGYMLSRGLAKLGSHPSSSEGDAPR